MRKDEEGMSSNFPLTKHSAIVASRSPDAHERRQAFELIIAAYWKPAYKHIRLKWHKSVEDAQDLTQAFFTQVIEKNYFRTYDPLKARFRTFLRTCLDGFLANERKAAGRIKRGGHVHVVSLDFETAEKGLDLAGSADDCFQKEWVRSVFELAVEELKFDFESKGKLAQFRIFERYDLESNATYESLAVEFGIPTTQVTNYLASARREFRRIVLEKLRELTGNDEEFRAEARSLLGIDVR
jgi:RNA polymerase sigma factor (sigma-70 family)